MFHVPNKFRVKNSPNPKINSTDEYGNNGCFSIKQAYGKKSLIMIQASDGMCWEHVSISLPLANRTPTWEEMCYVKGLFWDDDDPVIQIHPAKVHYVNYAKNCLHLWRSKDSAQALPPSILVGPTDQK